MEIHDSLSKEYFKFYTQNKFSAIIGLSATIDMKKKIDEDDDDSPTKGDYINIIAPIIDSISQSKAIELGLIANYEILVYYHNLEDKIKNVQAGTKASPFWQSEKAAYEYATKQFQRALYAPEATRKFAIQRAARQRSKILYDAASKSPVIKKLIKARDDFKFIIFGNSLDALHHITDNTVSSRNADNKNEEIKKAFEQNKTNVIASFKKLKQGANLKNVNIAILHSYYSVGKDYIQRVGRILRLDGISYNAVVIIVTVGTQEIDWSDKMLKDVTTPARGFHKIDDLVNYLKTK